MKPDNQYVVGGGATCGSATPTPDRAAFCETCHQQLPIPVIGNIVHCLRRGDTAVVTKTRVSSFSGRTLVETVMVTGREAGRNRIFYPEDVRIIHGHVHVNRFYPQVEDKYRGLSRDTYIPY